MSRARRHGVLFDGALVRRQVFQGQRLALQGEEQLMELAADAAFGRAIAQIAEGVLEAPQRPAHGDFRMLTHRGGRDQVPCPPRLHTTARERTPPMSPPVTLQTILRS